MIQEFYAIYKDLSTTYEARGRSKRMVQECIGDAVSRIDPRPRLRPDGEHFLLTSFCEMFVFPASHPLNPNPVAEQVLRQTIIHDVGVIIAAAGEEHPGEEITGKGILSATANLADSLLISRYFSHL